MFQTSPIPMWIYDADSLHFLQINEAAIRDYGYSREEFSRMTLRDIRAAEELTRPQQRIAKEFAQPDSRSVGIWLHRRKNGTVFPAEIIAHPLVRGALRTEMVIAIDVTDRVRVETERQEQIRLALLVAESAGALVSADSLRGGLQQCAELLNRHIEASFVRIWTVGADPGILLLQASAGDIVATDDQFARLPLSEPLIGEIARKGQAYASNDFYNSKRCAAPEYARARDLTGFVGYPLNVEDRVVGVAAAFARHPLTDAAVQAFASVANGTAQFIERKHAEEAARNLAALVENSGDAIVMTSAEFKITYLNESARRLMGFDHATQPLGHPVIELHPDAALAKLLSEAIPQLERGGEWRGETQLRHSQTGESIDVLMNAFQVRRPNGEVISFAAVMHDIRERKQAEEVLRRAKETAEMASRLKSEFMANMSHEIRTPMNGIIGMTELTLDTELNAEQRDYLETVKESANSLLEIIDDILNFSKIEAGRLTLDHIEFPVRKTLQDTLHLMAPGALRKSLELRLEIAPGVRDLLTGDPLRLRQIIFNLVGNAIKFTPAGSVTVRIGTDPSPPGRVGLHVEIQDTGIGIPVEKQRIIFEAFTQGDGSVSRRFGGTGLGLTICSRRSR